MGYILFWLEAAAVTVLLLALVVALSARIARRGWDRAIRIAAYFLMVLLALPVGVLAWVKASGGDKAILLFVAAGLIIAMAVHIRGLRVVQSEPLRRAAADWRLGRLGLAILAAAALATMTYWMLDLKVQQEMTLVRMEAGTMALSVAPPRVPEAQNAATLYKRAERLIERDDPQGQLNEKMRTWLEADGAAFDPKDPDLPAALLRNAGALDLLRKAGGMECDFSLAYNPPSIAMVFPNLGHFRHLARVACLSAKVHARSGRAMQAMEDVGAAFTLARHLSNESLLIFTLVAMAIEEDASRTLQDVLAAPPSAEALDMLKLDSTLSYSEALAHSLRMEQAFGLWMFSEQPKGGFAQVYNLSGNGTTAPPPGLILAGSSPYRVFCWRDDVACYRAWMERQRQLAAMPFYESHRQWQELMQEMRVNRTVSIITSISNALTPCFSSMAEVAPKADSRHRLAGAAVAAWRYRLKHGQFPDALQKLVPEFLPAVPQDPFSGKDMKMTRRADGQVVIYSLGPDMADDGGKPFDKQSKKGDLIFVLK